MIQITVDYFGPFRVAAGGISTESIQLNGPTPVEALVRLLAARHGERFGQLVANAADSSGPSYLCFLDQRQIGLDVPVGAKPDTVITLMSPIAGG